MVSADVKNLILDMGNVMMKFAPAIFIEREGITDPEDAELLMKEVFRSPDWVEMDWGHADEPETAAVVSQRLPEHLRETAARLIEHWYDRIIPVEGMDDVVREAKEKGYRLFLLSNASHAQHDYWEQVPGHECFEGTVVSADEQVVKPHAEIYRILLDRFGLKPEESLFVDDSAANVEGAEKLGMKGYLFDGDAEKFRRYLFG